MCPFYGRVTELAARLTADLVATYSLITIDAEPRVLRLWPTPTNHDVADAIAEWFEEHGDEGPYWGI